LSISGGRFAGVEPVAPKGGARFHFDLPGAVQGWQADTSVEARGTLTLENVAGHSEDGARSLALHYHGLAPGRVARVATATFVPPEALTMSGYGLYASPTLYPGQTVRARIAADDAADGPVSCRLYMRTYGANDQLERVYGPEIELVPSASSTWEWRIPPTGGQPIAEIGLELGGTRGANGTLYLDYLTWDGTPEMELGRPHTGGNVWRRAWVDGIDQYERWYAEAYRLTQNEGTGLLITGTREWADYTVAAPVRPHLAARAGIAARVQGMRRYYALLVCADGSIRLVKALDGDQVLAEAPCPWQLDHTYNLALSVRGTEIVAALDDTEVLRVTDTDRPLMNGAIALVIDEGRVEIDTVVVRAV